MRRRHRHQRRGRRRRDLGPGCERRGRPARRDRPPAIAGTPLDGQTLTADAGTWTGTGPITYTYQWQRCDAVGQQLHRHRGRDGQHLRARLRRRRLDRARRGDRRRTRRADLGRLADRRPRSPRPRRRPSTVPTVSGTVGAGQTLTAGDGTWNGSTPLDLHLPVAALRRRRHQLHGHRRRDRLDLRPQRPPTSTTPSASSSPRRTPRATTPPSPPPTAPSLPAPPVNTGTLPASRRDEHRRRHADRRPRHAGPARRRSPTRYQWQRCDADGTNCSDIAGATGDTYYARRRRRRPRDRASCVTATNAGGSTTQATSRRPRAVGAAPPVEHRAADHHRHAGRRQTLTADHRHLDRHDRRSPTPTSGSRCDADGTNCADIAGATDDDLHARRPPTSATRSRVVVTATNAGGNVSRRPRRADRRRRRRGAARHGRAGRSPARSRDGETLTAGDGTWTGTAPVTYTYQWQRCDADGTNCVDITGRDRRRPTR